MTTGVITAVPVISTAPPIAPLANGRCTAAARRPWRSRPIARPIFDPAKCIGCASNCPAREILVFDVCQEVRILQCLGRRCTFCGRCADVCPEKAITMSSDYEAATNNIEDLQQRIELFMSTCQRCGRSFTEPSPLEQLKLKGYRFDDLENQRVVMRSRAFLEGDAAVDDIDIELD